MLEDRWLTIRLRQGRPDALRRIYEKYRRYLLKIASALLHDRTVAEDIVHDVFMRLTQSVETVTINGSLKAYLRTCVINGVRNQVRAGKVRNHLELDDANAVASDRHHSDQWISLTEESQRINNALAQLPLEQREVIVLHLHGGMKFREIASLHNAALKTIQSRYRYGLDKLRSLLNSEVTK